MRGPAIHLIQSSNHEGIVTACGRFGYSDDEEFHPVLFKSRTYVTQFTAIWPDEKHWSVTCRKCLAAAGLATLSQVKKAGE